MGRHVVEPLEAAVVELLATARGVEPDHLDQDRVEEVGDRRVVERQVAVLADSGADDVGRLVEEPLFVGEGRPERPIGLLAGDQPEAVPLQADQAEQPFLEIPAERRPMVGPKAEVLIHVEPDHARPVDPSIGDQPGEEFVLARRGGEDHIRPGGDRLSGGDRPGHLVGGGPSHPGPILVDDDPERVDGELDDGTDIGRIHGGGGSRFGSFGGRGLRLIPRPGPE